MMEWFVEKLREVEGGIQTRQSWNEVKIETIFF